MNFSGSQKVSSSVVCKTSSDPVSADLTHGCLFNKDFLKEKKKVVFPAVVLSSLKY